MTFIVVSTAAGNTSDRDYAKPGDAYEAARAAEAGGVSAKIRLPSGEEVAAAEFRELYLLRDAD
jgi:hypothetical protein